MELSNPRFDVCVWILYGSLRYPELCNLRFDVFVLIVYGSYDVS